MKNPIAYHGDIEALDDSESIYVCLIPMVKKTNILDPTDIYEVELENSQDALSTFLQKIKAKTSNKGEREGSYKNLSSLFLNKGLGEFYTDQSMLDKLMSIYDINQTPKETWNPDTLQTTNTNESYAIKIKKYIILTENIKMNGKIIDKGTTISFVVKGVIQ